MNDENVLSGGRTMAVREAIRALASIIGKNEKAKLKLKEGSWQHHLTEKTLAAARISIQLLREELGEADEDGAPVEAGRTYTPDELRDVLEHLASLSERVEKMLPKFAVGTSQHTLTARRIEALTLASALIRRRSEIE